eukprot:14658.XXX_155493_155681_1 [CDS] Oithona nana genome sequencing.
MLLPDLRHFAQPQSGVGVANFQVDLSGENAIILPQNQPILLPLWVIFLGKSFNFIRINLSDFL